MSRGILKTALSTTIHLSLTYREPGLVNEAVARESDGVVAAVGSIPAEKWDTLYRGRWRLVGDVQGRRERAAFPNHATAQSIGSAGAPT